MRRVDSRQPGESPVHDFYQFLLLGLPDGRRHDSTSQVPGMLRQWCLISCDHDRPVPMLMMMIAFITFD